MRRRRHILAELAAMPKEDVEAELEQVREEKASLEMEEQLLGQVLRIRQFAESGISGSQETLDDLGAAAPELRERNISANVLAIVQQARGAELSPRDVQEVLADRGVQADLGAIRNALRRWAGRNRILKNGHVYRALARDVVAPHLIQDPNQ
jgi:predicted HTH domain antitoxin